METKGNHLIPTWFLPEALLWSGFGWSSAFASLCWTVHVNYGIRRNKFRKYLCIFFNCSKISPEFYQIHQFHTASENTSVQTLSKLERREIFTVYLQHKYRYPITGRTTGYVACIFSHRWGKRQLQKRLFDLISTKMKGLINVVNKLSSHFYKIWRKLKQHICCYRRLGKFFPRDLKNNGIIQMSYWATGFEWLRTSLIIV